MGLNLGLTGEEGWQLDLGYNHYRSRKTSNYDPSPGLTNEVEPLQGIIDGAFDSSNIKIRSKLQTIDLSLGKSFSAGTASITPYAGIRYAKYHQQINVQYLFPGGLEDFIGRSIKFSGFGPRVGIQGMLPINNSKFFVKGDMSVAKIFGGNRRQNISDTLTDSGGGSPVITDQQSLSENNNIDPIMFDGAISLGYNVNDHAAIDLGYRYSLIKKVLDTRDTNRPGFDPEPENELQGINELGRKNADFRTQGIYLEFIYHL